MWWSLLYFIIAVGCAFILAAIVLFGGESYLKNLFLSAADNMMSRREAYNDASNLSSIAALAVFSGSICLYAAARIYLLWGSTFGIEPLAMSILFSIAAVICGYLIWVFWDERPIIWM